MRALARWGVMLGAACCAAGATARPAGAQVVECARCHANRDFLTGKGRDARQDSALFVSATALQGTVHDSLKCTDCHRGFEAGYPHRTTAVVVPCQTCHEQAGRDWTASIHAANVSTKGDAPTCVGCHGSHVVYGVKDVRSPVYPLNVAALCGRCHGDARIIGTYFATPAKLQGRIATAQYPKSVHGVALTRDGLVVSATCNNCHGAHKVLPADSAASSVNPANIPATCGACHAGIAAVYDSSAHGPIYPAQHRTTEAGQRRPVCIDCHSAHGIVRADQPQWQLDVVQECGKCHERLYETYFDTYHGKVTRLGFNLAAKCSDCHTAHNMRPATDSLSSVHALNLVKTCARCHEGAGWNFVKYYAHGDPKQRTKYPLLYWPWLFMTTLLVSVIGFFALHTGLWLLRSAIDYLRGAGHSGEPPASSGTTS
ncbi:MAG TPA: cytochrome c3 family protein [Gemmatimonadales bacterium]|nr:cytochrome c3 family protein [Gemmatimonadales bacterium]